MQVPQKELHRDVWFVTHLENIRPLYLAYIAEENMTAIKKISESNVTGVLLSIHNN